MKDRGIVKWFNQKKGWGFITHCDTDIFVHYSDIMGKGFRFLTEGQTVKFGIVQTSKGLKAESVEVVP